MRKKFAFNRKVHGVETARGGRSAEGRIWRYRARVGAMLRISISPNAHPFAYIWTHQKEKCTKLWTIGRIAVVPSDFGFRHRRPVKHAIEMIS